MDVIAAGLTYTYPGAESRALSQLDARVEAGITGLVGVNGAGKSTLLRILARAIAPDEGAVTVDGADLSRSPRREIAPRIGFMPQEFSLPFGAKVMDSLIYLGWIKGVPASATESRAKELLDALGLGHLRSARVSALSGGMVRRLALAQALLSRPDVLLLDEPTTGLDPEQRVVVRQLLADPRFQAEIIVVSSHVMEDVETLAGQVILVEAGRVAFAGSLPQFCTLPDGSSEDAESAFVRHLVSARG